MKIATLAAVLCLATPAFTSDIDSRGRDTYPLTYDTLYDGGQTQLSSVACSTGSYGLMNRGINFLSQVPTFPAIGGIPMISGWNSSNCGTCWLLTFTDGNGNPFSITYTAVNDGPQNPDGFTISKAGMNTLTHGNADTLNGVTIHVAQLLADYCAL